MPLFNTATDTIVTSHPGYTHLDGINCPNNLSFLDIDFYKDPNDLYLSICSISPFCYLKTISYVHPIYKDCSFITYVFNSESISSEMNSDYTKTNNSYPFFPSWEYYIYNAYFILLYYLVIIIIDYLI